MSQRYPIVYFPVEFQSREFDSKILLALTLAQRGYAAVVGQQWMLSVNYETLPAGTVLFKSFNKIHHAAMQQARAGGHFVAALEEELLAQSEEKGVAFSCADGIFRLVDLILANGEFEQRVMASINNGSARIEISGNSRVDLLKPDFRDLFAEKIDQIKQEHGDYVLVNTNFGIHNSVWQSKESVTEIGIKAGVIKPDDPQSVKDWQEYIDYEDANRKEIYAAISELSGRRPEQKIIVRPHPNENLQTWEEKFGGVKNVAIIREGSHMPWTMAAKVLLHTSCTTGFEAYVAGTPAVSLVPYNSWVTSSLLSNKVNPIFPSASSVVDAIEKILDGATAPEPDAANRPPEFYVWNAKKNNAASKISDLLTQMLPAQGRIELPSLRSLPLSPTLKAKFDVSLQECRETAARIRKAAKIDTEFDVEALQDSVFLISNRASASAISIGPLLPKPEQILAMMETALRERNHRKVLKLFEQNLIEAEQSSACWYLAGIAVFELGKPSEALRYFQRAVESIGSDVNFQLLFMLAVTHRKLGQFQDAMKYAELAHRKAPDDPRGLELYKSLQVQFGQGSKKK